VKCVIRLANGLGHHGIITFPELHQGFFVFAPPRRIEPIIEALRLREIDLAAGLCSDLAGLTSLPRLALGVAAAIETRIVQRVSPVEESSLRRYLRDLLKLLAAKAKELGVPWKAEWFLESVRGVGVRLAADVRIVVG
jgi:hypothetical protein